MRRAVVIILALSIIAAGSVLGYRHFSSKPTSLQQATSTAQDFTQALQEKDAEKLRALSTADNGNLTVADINRTLSRFGGPETTLVPDSVISEFHGTGVFTVSRSGHQYRFTEAWEDTAQRFLVNVSRTY